MISRAGARIDASDHDNLRGLLVQERVTENHGKFGGAERNVRLSIVECSDAFFQG